MSKRKLYDKLVKEISRPLSNIDIVNALDNKVKTVIYGDIKDMTTADEFFYPYDSVVLLYETDVDVGHWICVQRRVNDKGEIYIEFFDPYGDNLDETLEFSVNDKYPYLTKLFYESGIDDYIWSNMRLQKLEDNVNTCGRWCIARLRYKDLCLGHFQDMIIKSGYYPKLNDLLVYEMTKDV